MSFRGSHGYIHEKQKRKQEKLLLLLKHLQSGNVDSTCCSSEGLFMDIKFIGWLQRIGLVLEMTPPGCLDMNGLAERTIRIVRMTTTMLYAAGIPGVFWPDAARTAAYLRNRCPTGKTPYELWHDRKPPLGYFRVFGCRCYAHIQERDRDGKLGARIVEAVFFGYYNTVYLQFLMSMLYTKLLKRRDVVFHGGILSHPSLRQLPGFDILGKLIEDLCTRYCRTR